MGSPAEQTWLRDLGVIETTLLKSQRKHLLSSSSRLSSIPLQNHVYSLCFQVCVLLVFKSLMIPLRHVNETPETINLHKTAGEDDLKKTSSNQSLPALIHLQL